MDILNSPNHKKVGNKASKKNANGQGGLLIGEEEFKELDADHEKIDVFMEYNMLDEAV
jgi:hypothetical protein